MRQAWHSFGRPEADLRAIAASLDIPIWVAWGRRDKVIPLARCLPAITRMKHVTVSEFDAGRSAFLECPAVFAQQFAAFAAALSSMQPAALRAARAYRE
jgi:pimeloyl-ACP methyl ester carboxylesterase